MIRLLHAYEFPGAPAPKLQLQPAGFDLTAASVASFAGAGVLDLTNEHRRLSVVTELGWPANGQPLVLQPGGYLVTYSEEVAVPPDCAGLVLPRSSLMRCGATLHSALWDPGYRGRGQGLLTVYSPLALYSQARIGQLVFILLETAAPELYAGKYQGEHL